MSFKSLRASSMLVLCLLLPFCDIHKKYIQGVGIFLISATRRFPITDRLKMRTCLFIFLCLPGKSTLPTIKKKNCMWMEVIYLDGVLFKRSTRGSQNWRIPLIFPYCILQSVMSHRYTHIKMYRFCFRYCNYGYITNVLNNCCKGSDIFPKVKRSRFSHQHFL